MPRRLLLVNKLYAPDIGGVETVVAQYARWATQAGWSVTVLCCSGQRTLMTVDSVGAHGIRIVRACSLGTLLSMPIALTFPLWLWRLAAEADVIHFHEPFPLATIAQFALRNNDRFLVTWHSDIVRQRLFAFLLRPFQSLMLRRAALITATSHRLVEYSSLLRRHTKKIRVIPLSVDAPKGEIATPATLPRLPRKFMLFLGRLVPYKGITPLLAAMDRLRAAGCHFVIAGAGPLAPMLASATRGSSNVVLITRHVTEDEKHYLLRACHALLFPSSMANEAFGILQLEAMILGKPVINTSLPTGVPWVSVHHETGITVPPGDAVSLAAAIETLWSNERLVTEYGTNATARVERLFSTSRVQAALLETYSELVAGDR